MREKSLLLLLCLAYGVYQVACRKTMLFTVGFVAADDHLASGLWPKDVRCYIYSPLLRARFMTFAYSSYSEGIA
jgi:hypothetical protein